MADKLPANFKDTALDRIRQGREKLHNWRSEARNDYAFVSGDQWFTEDITTLTAQKRPPVTFNYSEKMVDAVVGAEVNARNEVHYAPREMSDDAGAELMTSAARWARSQCDAEDQDSDAFRDMLICGLGWSELRMSYERVADGMIEIERIDPLEMLYDPAAIKRGLSDRRWCAREWWVDERDAHTQWPSAVFYTDASEDHGGGVVTRGRSYSDDTTESENDEDLHRDQVRIVHYQCVEREPYYRIADADKIHEVSVSDYNKLKDTINQLGIPAVRQTRLVYYRAFFAGETLLQAERSPCQDGFTFNVITGKRDRNKNTWYGLTRVMKDPQRWANKWLSQIIHIINVNAKGGLMAETGAFADPTRAAEEWASPDSITLLTEGGINKIKPKDPTPYPTGLDRLMEFALSSLPQVTGINLEALGLAGREQANVLEQSRKQAAYGLLAPLFDALRCYRKEQGRVLLYYIRNYLSDGRLMRIVGEKNAQAVPLIRVPDYATYDVIVDQSPNAPDVKQRTWETLSELIPSMLKAGVAIPPQIFDYTPLPTTLAQEWKNFLEQNKSQVDPQQMEKLTQQMQKLQEENMKLQMQLRDKSQEIELKQVELQQDLELERYKVAADLQLKQLAANQQREIQLQQAGQDMAMKATMLGLPEAPSLEGVQQGHSEMAAALDQIGNVLDQLAQTQNAVVEAVAGLQQAMSAPRTARMPDGRVITMSTGQQ